MEFDILSGACDYGLQNASDEHVYDSTIAEKSQSILHENLLFCRSIFTLYRIDGNNPLLSEFAHIDIIYKFFVRDCFAQCTFV